MKEENKLTPNEGNGWTTRIKHSLEPFDDSEEIIGYYMAYPGDVRKEIAVLTSDEAANKPLP